MHYRQDQLAGIPLKVRLRKLYGDVRDSDRVGWVQWTLTERDDVVLFGGQSRPTMHGRWDEWVDLRISISDLSIHCALKFEYNGFVNCIELHENGFLRQGLCKILLRGIATPPPFENVIREVGEAQWKRIGWLDSMSFEAIAREQLKEAVANNQMFLIVEFPRFDAKIKMRDEWESVAESVGQRDVLMADCQIRPYTFMPHPQEGMIIKPSPRSLPILLKLQREAAIHMLPAAVPGLLWKYRDWLSEQDQFERLFCHFIKSVDWIDSEEVAIAKKCVSRVRIKQEKRLSLLISLLSLISRNKQLSIFEEELSGLLKQTISTLSSDVEVYILAIFLKGMEGKTFKLLHAQLWGLLKEAAGNSLYAAMSVYWMLEREDMIGRREWRDMVGKQRMLIDCLQYLVDKVREGRDRNRLEKRQFLCNLLRDPPDQCPPLLAPFLSPPVSLPTEPAVAVTGVIPEHTSVYKSTAMPVKIAFLGQGDCQEHAVIIKTGEALDSDLMVMRFIGIVDEIWLSCGHNYHMRTYSVLPICHQNGGWLEFVPSSSLSAILSDHGNSLLPYLMTPDNVERYVRSCAGYCIVSYVLGLGDRHLENLLLTPDGCLFHVDYAYLFGADPKPFPPPMKLCREMVEAMGGGIGSEEFAKFKNLTLQGYQIARLNAGILIDFLALHLDIVGAEELEFVRARLALDKSDAEALEMMDKLIVESVNAMFPQVLETIHKWSQYWRS